MVFMRSAGLTSDQGDRQEDAPRLFCLLRNKIEEQAHSGLASFIKRDMYSRQWRDRIRCHRYVVTSDNSTILRNTQPALMEGTEHTDSHGIVMHIESGEIRNTL